MAPHAPLRAALSTLALAIATLGCATPDNIIEKSAASAQLYTDVLSAHATLNNVIERELVAGDRAELIFEVRSGEKLDLDAPLTVEADTQAVIAALRSVRTSLEISQILFGTVDRFVRIRVFDLEDAQELVGAANKASAALGAGN